jgi:hypothetical protein
MYKFYFILGDWSDDGHGKYEKILIESSHTVKEVQDAYKQSCKTTGISFNDPNDFTGIKREYRKSKLYHVCAEYEQNQLSNEIFECFLKLHKKGHPCKILEDMNKNKKQEGLYVDRETFMNLFFWFVSLSLKNFTYKRLEDEYPTLNGYWNKNLNVQFGYGLF